MTQNKKMRRYLNRGISPIVAIVIIIVLGVIAVGGTLFYIYSWQPTEPQAQKNTSNNLNCQNLWWYDSDHKTCSQKQFCGLYMYLGLKTFSTQETCNIDLKIAE